MDILQLLTVLILCSVAAFACLLIFISIKAQRGNGYLCTTCKFNNSDSCQKPDRPQVLQCYAYIASATSKTN